MSAKQWMPVSILGGLEGNTDEHLKTRLETVENLVYRNRGSLAFRYGTEKLVDLATVAEGSTTAPAIPETLAVYRNECLRFGRGELTTYSDALDKRVYRDNASEATVTVDGVTTVSVPEKNKPNVAYGGGYAVYIYKTGTVNEGDVFVTVTDSETGAVILNNYQLTATDDYDYPRVVYVNSTFIAVYAHTNGTIAARTMSTATPSTWTSQTSLRTDGDGMMFDVTTFGTTMALGYCKDNAGTLSFELYTYNSALSQVGHGTSTQSLGAATESRAVSLVADTTRIWMAMSYAASGTDFLKLTIFGAVPSGGSLTEAISPASVDTAMGATTLAIDNVGLCIWPGAATECVVVYNKADVVNLGFFIHVKRFNTSGTDIITTSRRTTDTCRIISKPFAQDSRVYFIGTCGDGTNVVIDANAGGTSQYYRARPVATFAPRQDTQDGYATDILPLIHVTSTATNTWRTIYLTDTIYQATIAFNEPRQVATIGNVCVVSGGVPSSYDGVTLAEVGSIATPTIVSAAAASTGSLSTGSYGYMLMNRWTDANGNVHRSAPSPIYTRSVTSGQKVVVKFFNIGLTTKQDFENDNNKIIHELYRTAANGTTFYLVETFDGDAGSANAVNNLHQGVLEFTYNDTASDASISTATQIYTLPDANGVATVLENMAPPSAKYVVAHRNRFWLGGTDDDTIWYSKSVVQLEGPAFNEVLTVLPWQGGRVTGLASLDNYLVVFKNDSIFIIMGDGHDDTGSGSTLSEPVQVSNAIGCVDARSIAVATEGVYFLSARGIYLLARNTNELIFVGEDVVDRTQADDVTLTSAVIVPDQNQVRFTFLKDIAANSFTLVWDYVSKAWTTFTYYDSSELDTNGAASACLVGGVYRWVTPEGQEYNEDKTTYLDCRNHFTPRSLETGWIRVGDVQNYQRVSRAQLLGQNHDPHQVMMTESVDYRDDSIGSQSCNSAAIPANYPVQYEFGIVRQRCEAIKLSFLISTYGSPTTGRGLTITGLGLLVSAMRGKWRVPSSRRAS